MVKRNRDKGGRGDAPNVDRFGEESVPEMPEAWDALPEANPSKQKGDKWNFEQKWKAAQLDVEILKEFEAAGGCMLEECDDDDMVVRFGVDEGEEPHKKKRKKKHKGQNPKEKEKDAAPDADVLQKENAALKVELEALRARDAAASAEARREEAAAALPLWQEFDLHPALLSNIHRLGFTQPTAVQASCLTPAIRQRKDIVGAAETGSGKTLAFGLPILHHILHSRDAAAPTEGAAGGEAEAEEANGTAVEAKSEFAALIILPTRELAVQVQKHINDAAVGTSVHCECVVGGMAIPKQQRLLRRKPPIVVGTPGRLFALMGMGQDPNNERCDFLCSGLKDMRHLVLDEADRLVESGHFKELDRVLSAVYGALRRPQQLQTMIFSATLTLDPLNQRHRIKEGSDTNKVEALMRRLKFREARAVHAVDLTKAEKGSGGSSEARVVSAKLPAKLQCKEVHCTATKDRECILVLWLLKRYRWSLMEEERGGGKATDGGRVLVFTNSVTMVMRLASIIALILEAPSADQVLSRIRMKQGKSRPIGAKVEVLGLHSQMRQKDRMKKMERFQKCTHGVLLCTDIAARGLDVPELSAVVHYQCARNAETFVHRSGRTARAGCVGESVAFMCPKDSGQWQQLYRAVGIDQGKVQVCSMSGFEVDAAKEASRLAASFESQVHRSKKKMGERSWMKKAADECDLMLSEDEDDGEIGKSEAPRKLLWGLYQQMQHRVRRPPKSNRAQPLPLSQRHGHRKPKMKGMR